MTKIIHCADLHLDSKMDTSLSPEKADERRTELVQTFRKMIKYAADSCACAVMISGDLFDRETVSLTTLNTVTEQIKMNPDILFFYLRGNHDAHVFKDDYHELPENLKLFDSNWKSYDIPKTDITVYGIEINDAFSKRRLSGLKTVPDKFNIVMLHGDIFGSGSENDPLSINIKDLENKNIDYLALGHIHIPGTGDLRDRGIWHYPGCIEGRGFDECGEHGFTEIDITDTGNFKIKFIPAAKRRFFEICSDITGCKNSEQMINLISDDIEKSQNQISVDDILKVNLTGETESDTEKNPEYIENYFQSRYYFAEVTDSTTLHIDYDAYKYDRSLKGEFIRLVENDTDIGDDEKSEIIKCGFKALSL